MHQFLKFIFGMKLHVSDSSSVHHQGFSLCTQQWYMSYRFADGLRAGSGWNRPDEFITMGGHLNVKFGINALRRKLGEFKLLCRPSI